MQKQLSIKMLSDVIIGWEGAARETRARLLKDFCSGIHSSTFFSNSATALVVGGFVLVQAHESAYFAWLLIALLGGLMPRLYALRLRHKQTFHEFPEHKALTFIAISALYGLLWGIGPLLVLPDLNGAATGIFLMLIVLATIMGPYAAMPGILYARLLATGIPTLIAIALYVGPEVALISLILSLWLGLRTDVWRGYHRVLRREIEFRGVLEAQREKLRHANLAEQKLNEALKRLAETDPLTGTANRRQFIRGYELLTGSGAILLLDIDQFKSINDRFGHQVGDNVLATLARVIKSKLRDEDLLARLGGDEFSVLMPGVSAAEAGAIAERVRKAVAQMNMSIQGKQLRITISIGVTVIPPGVAPIGVNDFLYRADAQLYAAKRRGRNRVCEDASESTDTSNPMRT